MNFERTEEERLLTESVQRYLHKDYGFEVRTAILAGALGYSDTAWERFADMGVLGLTLPEDCGGFGGGAVALSGVMECLGEALCLEPVFSTVGLCARLVARGAGESQRSRLLEKVAAGRLRMGFAHFEDGARHDLAHVAATARRNGGGWELSGTKRVVLDAPSAGVLVVSARTSGTVGRPEGLSLFLVDINAVGVELKPARTLDGRRCADVVLSDVSTPHDALLGIPDEGFGLIEDAVDFATALLCAEAVGVMTDANAATLEFLKTRRQFGAAIGSFQVLQHRMADMYIATEQARSMACLACFTVDSAGDARERARIVSAAKVLIAQACRRVSQDAVQLHGGMGLTEEMKVSHSFRRLTLIAQQFGDEDHHLERFAACAAEAEGAREGSAD